MNDEIKMDTFAVWNYLSAMYENDPSVDLKKVLDASWRVLRELAEEMRISGELGTQSQREITEYFASKLDAILDAEGDGVAVGDPAAWMMTCAGYERPVEFYTEKPAFVPAISEIVPLYIHPARSGVVSDEDVRDAERYRYLRSANADDDVPYVAMQKTNDWGKTAACWLQEDEADKAIDAAIQGERHER